MTPSTQKKLGEILYLLICSFLLCMSGLLRRASSEVPEGLMNYPVLRKGETDGTCEVIL